MISLSISWLATAALRTRGPVYFMVRCTPSCKKHELEKLKIFALLHDFLVNCLTFYCCPHGWGGGCFLWCQVPLHASNASLKKKRKYLHYCMISLSVFFWLTAAALRTGGLFIARCNATLHVSNTSLEKHWKTLLYYMNSLSIFDLLLLPWGLGSLFLHGAKYLFMQAMQAWKKKIFAPLHDFLVYFLTCWCCPQGRGACLLHGSKQPFRQATQAWKHWKLCSIVWFSCLFFDLMLLPSRLGSLFIAWYNAPLHSCNVSLKNWKSLLYCMISLSISWFAAAALKVGGLFISWCKALFHACNMSLENIENLCTIAWFPFLFLDLLLLPSELGGLFISCCDAPLHVIHSSLKTLKIFALLHDFIAFFWFAAAALKAGGPVYFMVQSTPSCKQGELELIEKLCIIAWYPCLFLTCCWFHKGWETCFFHGAKNPFMPATQAWKIEIFCSIAWLPCLFFDLLLLP